VESDTGRAKIGDGASPWRDLTYFASGVGVIGSLVTHSHLVGDVIGFGSGVRATPLSGLAAGPDAPIVDSDTVLAAFAKLQSQISSVGLPEPLSRSAEWTPGHLVNGRLVASVSGGNLTVAVKTLSGADPSSGNPVHVIVGDTARTLSEPLFVTASSGTNWLDLGAPETAGQTTDLFAYLVYDTLSSVTRICVSRIPSGRFYVDISAGYNQRKGSINNGNPGSSDRVENIGRLTVAISAAPACVWSIPVGATVCSSPVRETRWLGYTPIVSAPGGMTISGVSASCRYKIAGDTLFCQGTFSLTAGGTPSSTLLQSLPMGRSIATADESAGSGYIHDSADMAAIIAFDGTNTSRIKIVKSAGTYAAGSVSASFCGSYAV
jgi:hypothetical protein